MDTSRLPHRFTVYADLNLPRGHAATLTAARALAAREPDARYIVKRLRAYPFTHLKRYPL